MITVTEGWTLNIPVLLLACILVAVHWITNENRLRRASWFFLSGIALLVGVTMSPLDYLAHHYYVFVHMIQHVIVLLIVPPLLILGTPPQAAERILGHPSIKGAAYLLFHPVVAWILGIGTMWFWHIPLEFYAAIHSRAIHYVQILTLLFLGIVFIWPVYAPVPFRKLSPLLSVLYLFTACVACTVLGIFISFSSEPLYSGAFSMAEGTMRSATEPLIPGPPFQLSPKEDQQIAGLIMWVPACAIYITNIMVILARWFGTGNAQDGMTTGGITSGQQMDNPKQQ